ncbi:hypothetical protein SHIRM173S_13021 [Streptomyces hirsutus]
MAQAAQLAPPTMSKAPHHSNSRDAPESRSPAARWELASSPKTAKAVDCMVSANEAFESAFGHGMPACSC